MAWLMQWRPHRLCANVTLMVDLDDGFAIPIEQRDPEEVTHVQGKHDGATVQVQITPDGSPAGNYAFDVTPARLISGLITEHGVCPASEAGLRGLFPGGARG